MSHIYYHRCACNLAKYWPSFGSANIRMNYIHTTILIFQNKLISTRETTLVACYFNQFILQYQISKENNCTKIWIKKMHNFFKSQWSTQVKGQQSTESGLDRVGSTQLKFLSSPWIPYHQPKKKKGSMPFLWLSSTNTAIESSKL